MIKTSDPVVKDSLGIFARLLAIAIILTMLGSLLQGCSDQCDTYYTYTDYQAVTVSMEEFKTGVQLEEPRSLHNPGKIYMKEPYLFISEAGEGVHIFDNSDKSNPVPKAFLKIPGSYDVAVLGNVLYSDSYTDLLAFDITEVQDIKEIKRVEDVFKSRLNHHYFRTQSNELVVDYAPFLVEREYEADCDDDIYYNGNREFLMSDGGGASGDVVNHAGQGGSMARFTMAANHLYAVDASNLYVFNLDNPFAPAMQQSVGLGWNIETIFPYEDKLFVGSSTGMHILDNSNPANPVYATSFNHAFACDPVVVENDVAYVTLRTGNACEGSINQLDLVDVSDIYNPVLLKTYPMENPHGLGIDKGKLFLCEGDFGLKVFDASDINKIDENLIEHLDEIKAYDVIPFQSVLLLIGEGGFYQFDYSDINNIKLLSHIPVVAQVN
jgi:hypothetical protein